MFQSTTEPSSGCQTLFKKAWWWFCSGPKHVAVLQLKWTVVLDGKFVRLSILIFKHNGMTTISTAGGYWGKLIRQPHNLCLIHQKQSWREWPQKVAIMNTEVDEHWDSTLSVTLADNTATLLENVPIVCQQIWHRHNGYPAHYRQTVRTYESSLYRHRTWKQRLGDVGQQAHRTSYTFKYRVKGKNYVNELMTHKWLWQHIILVLQYKHSCHIWAHEPVLVQRSSRTCAQMEPVSNTLT
jgi:hypothetical protein